MVIITTIPRNIAVDNETIGVNENGAIEIKGGSVTDDLVQDNSISKKKLKNRSISWYGWDLIYSENISSSHTETINFSKNVSEIYVITEGTGTTSSVASLSLRVNNINSGYQSHGIQVESLIRNSRNQVTIYQAGYVHFYNIIAHNGNSYGLFTYISRLNNYNNGWTTANGQVSFNNNNDFFNQVFFSTGAQGGNRKIKIYVKYK